jgi:hypothetical protein
MTQTHLDNRVHGIMDSLPDSQFNLRLSLLPRDIQASWTRCGLTANFLAGSPAVTSKKLFNVMSTVMNEILENAVKYSANPMMPIEVVQRFKNGLIECEVSNWARREDAEAIDAYFKAILGRDPDELFYTQLEQLDSTNKNQSQIGLIGMVRDYKVKLGCRIHITSDAVTPYQITVKAIINVTEVEAVC